MHRQITYRLMTFAVALAIAGMFAAVSGCNTIEGMGEAVSAVGDAVDEGAEETNPYDENDDQ